MSIYIIIIVLNNKPGPLFLEFNLCEEKLELFLKDRKWRDIAPLKGDKVERRRVVIKGGDPADC